VACALAEQFLGHRFYSKKVVMSFLFSHPVCKRLSGSTTAVIQKVKQSESKDNEKCRESLTAVRHGKTSNYN
jgi:hypothetical protein